MEQKELDPEEKIMCPYNHAHLILRKRMNTHLVKCKKNYPDSKLVECDFNVCHKIPEPELQYHHENCPDRNKIEITVYQEKGMDLNKYPIINKPVPCDECWDDLNTPTYDPQKHIENKEVIRHLDVASAAKRREFRMNERKRIAQQIASQEQRPHTSSKTVHAFKPLPDYGSVLPRQQRIVVDEETPRSVTDLLERIRLEKNKPIIPKNKNNA